MKTGMPLRYENPREVGADRIVNAVAAFEMFSGPVLAVDFGTATTFEPTPTALKSSSAFTGRPITDGIARTVESTVSSADGGGGAEGFEGTGGGGISADTFTVTFAPGPLGIALKAVPADGSPTNSGSSAPTNTV